MSDRSPTPCNTCGEENYSTAFIDCPTKRTMDKKGVCYSCAYWADTIERASELTIIDSTIYSPGSNTSEPSSWRGMSGRRFDIEYFNGRRVTTFDLWSGGGIPERFRSELPDNARFLSGAERCDIDVGTHVEPGTIISCWNPSNPRTPCYPLPNGRKVPERLAPGGYADEVKITP